MLVGVGVTVPSQRASGRMDVNRAGETALRAGHRFAMPGPPENLRDLEAAAGAAITAVR